MISGDFTHYGGMDRANLELASHFANQLPVHLVGHRVAATLQDAGSVTVHKVARPFGKHLLGAPLLAIEGRAWARHLTRQGYRVIVNGGNCSWGDVNWLHCVHTAYSYHSTSGSVSRLKSFATHRLAQQAEKRIIRKASLVICNSKRTARDAVNLLGVQSDRVHVVYLGIDPEQFPPITRQERTSVRQQLAWEDRPWIGFVGQLGNRIKNFDTLFATWQKMCTDPAWDVNLAVIGAGKHLTAWKQRTAESGLDQRIRFLGYRTDVATVLAGCDAVVHPARYDAYGLAAHEAVCRGLPVIISSAAGFCECYPDELTQLIIEDPESTTELAERLKYWRRNLEMIETRLQPCSINLRKRTWNQMASDIQVLITP